MKRYLLLFIGIIMTLNGFAQNNSNANQDIILKSNGEEMKGKVTQISDH